MGRLTPSLGAFILIQLLIILDGTSPAAGETGSTIFKRLMRNYRSDEPPRTDESTEVRIGMYINTFFSISELNMDYSMSFYLRQAWRDPRLSFDDDEVDSIRLPDGGWNSLWLPDTFVRNEKGAGFHAVTVSNRLAKINSTGDVWYVSKISMTLSCPMNLRLYPFDTQTCPVMFESFGYKKDRLHYTFLDTPVDLDTKIQLPKFKMRMVSTDDCSQNYTSGSYTCQRIDFVLDRDTSSHILQYYIPTMALVVLSWFTFWFPVDVHPIRIILLFMPVMLINSIWTKSQGLLPKVSYIKAMDVWMIGCGAFVFSALFELAFVNIIMDPKAQGKDESDSGDKGEGMVDRIKNSFARSNTVSKIDKVCRFVFPLSFFLFVVIYFIYYSG